MPDPLRRAIRWVTWSRRNTVVTVVAAAIVLLVAARVFIAGSAPPAAAPLPPPSAPAATAGPQASSTPAPTAAAPTAAVARNAPARAVNIYRWLPFTPASLAGAARVTEAFARAYATYTPTESAAAYTGRMKTLVTPSLAATLGRGFATPGLARQRSHGGLSMTGTGRITALRAFGHTSITFLVTVVQRATGHGSAARSSTGYAITAGRAGRGWRVSDIELASAGNT